MDRCFTLTLFVTCLLIAGSCHVDTAESSSSRPNIVLMMADDLGTGDIGCFGNTTLRTPNIDSLASDGVRLDHDLAAASLCTPSRAAFQTGRYPVRMGMAAPHILRVHLFQASAGGLPPDEVTIGELAQSQGYATGFIGKWHLGTHCRNRSDFCHHPMKNGYDYFFGLPISNGKDFGDEGLTVVESRFPHLRVAVVSACAAAVLLWYTLKHLKILSHRHFVLLAVLSSLPAVLVIWLLKNGPWISGMVLRGYEVVEQPIVLPGFTDRLIAESVDYLRERKEDGPPFLLIVSWIQVHTALHALDPFKGRSAHGPYGDEVEELDWSVGQILNALDDLGLSDNTLVYFTSDHGGHLEEKGLGGAQEGGWNGIYKGGKTHGGMEGGVRVPSVMRWPGVLPEGRVVSIPTSHMDILPTVAGIVGADLPKDRRLDGTDILPVLKGEPAVTPPHRFLVHYCGTTIHSTRYVPGDGSDVYKAFYATHKYFPGTYECQFSCSCTDVHWHDPPLLFNVARDPSEEHPLDPRDPKHRQILDAMDALLTDHKDSLDPNVESQFNFVNYVPLPWLQLCCNFPYCSCREERTTLVNGR